MGKAELEVAVLNNSVHKSLKTLADMKGDLPLHSWTGTYNSSLFCKQKGANLPETQG